MDFCTGLVSFAVPLKALDLGASVAELGVLGTAASLCFTLALTFSGKLAERYDRRCLMVIATGVTSLVYCLLLFATNYWMLLIGAMLGWGLLALFWPPLQATLAENQNRKKLVKVLGTFNIFWTMGFLCGPAVGGYLYLVGPQVPFALGIHSFDHRSSISCRQDSAVLIRSVVNSGYSFLRFRLSPISNVRSVK